MPERPQGAAIPKIIHQTYRSRQLPAIIENNVANLRRLNPSWDYRFYDDDDVLSFIGGNFSDRVLERFRRINPRYGAARADLFRYLLMYKVGGVYLDIKSSATKPLDEVLLKDDMFVLSQWDNAIGEPHQNWGFHKELGGIAGGEFQQWHIISVAGHPFIKAVLESVMRNINAYNPALHGTGQLGVVRCTGPIAYTLAIAPLLELHRHRFAHSKQDLGLEYSLFDSSGGQSHKDLFLTHYTRLDEPVVNVGLLKGCLAMGI